MRLMRFYDKLQRLARQRGLRNQEALAAFLEVNQTTVSRWQSGAVPHYARAVEIADRFRIPVETLLDDTKNPPFDEYVQDIADSSRIVAEARLSTEDERALALDYAMQAKRQKRMAARLRKVLAELTSIVAELDPEHSELSAIAAQLKEIAR